MEFYDHLPGFGFVILTDNHQGLPLSPLKLQTKSRVKGFKKLRVGTGFLKIFRKNEI